MDKWNAEIQSELFDILIPGHINQISHIIFNLKSLYLCFSKRCTNINDVNRDLNLISTKKPILLFLLRLVIADADEWTGEGGWESHAQQIEFG